MTATAAQRLAGYAAGLRFEDLPEDVVRLAKYCLIDACACAIHGSRLPWSRIVLEMTLSSAGAGPCGLLDVFPRGLPPAPAALCLGAFAHAFELDSLRKPGAGVHPGATVAMPALAVAQAVGAGGRDLVAAIAAGCEVMFRIGDATLHSSEKAGFHAPGITGPFGAATAAGRLMKLDAGAMARAYGIAGSLSAGLLNFARSRDGGMVKRLHLGRAAEAGVLAAELAARGFEGPLAVLEGKYGVLDAFCEASEPERLTAGLGSAFEIRKLCLKRYACHVTAQAPIQLFSDLAGQHRISGDRIRAVSLEVSDKVLSHHSERRPTDLMLAQYSVPFSLAVAVLRDPDDPGSFDDSALADPAIGRLAETMELVADGRKGWDTRMRLRLDDGTELDAEASSFMGCPETPFGEADLLRKFARLAGPAHAHLAERLLHMERATRSTELFSM